MKIIITGATGFVGTHLARLLKAQKHDVYALVRPSSKTEELSRLGVRFVVGGLEHGQLPARLPAFDAVIHLAGLIKAKSTNEFHDINAMGTRRLIKALDRDGLRRFLLVSSIAARGPNANATDYAGIGPVSEYGKSKLDGEIAARELLGDDIVTIFRPPPVYGPSDTAMLSLFKLFKHGLIPSFANGDDGKISFIFVTDLAKILAAAVTAPSRQGTDTQLRPYDTEDGAGGYSRGELSEAIKLSFGKTPRVLKIPAWITGPAATATELVGRVRGAAPFFSRDKLRELSHPFWFSHDPACHRDFGLSRPVGITEGFAKTRSWYEKAGWL